MFINVFPYPVLRVCVPMSVLPKNFPIPFCFLWIYATCWPETARSSIARAVPWKFVANKHSAEWVCVCVYQFSQQRFSLYNHFLGVGSIRVCAPDALVCGKSETLSGDCHSAESRTRFDEENKFNRRTERASQRACVCVWAMQWLCARCCVAHCTVISNALFPMQFP